MTPEPETGVPAALIPQPGHIRVFADIGCPWAHLAIYRLHEARARLGYQDELSFDVRAFPLEIFNQQPTPALILATEIPVTGALAPDAGWSQWRASPYSYPVTTLPAMEAVYAAKEQGIGRSDRLDRALRVALFKDARCISLEHEVLGVATEVGGLDVAHLQETIRSGRARKMLFDDLDTARSDAVQGSPHVFLPDGRDFHNPGIEMHWEGKAFPVVDSDDASIYEDLIKTAVS